MPGYLTDGLPQFTGPFTGNERLFLDTTIPGGAFPQLAYVTFNDLAGAIAAQITGGGGTPAWLPAGALAFADFSAGHYYADGAETTASGIGTVDADNWMPRYSDAIVPGTGLVDDSSGTGAVLVSSATTYTITNGATFVFSWDGGECQVIVTDFPDYTNQWQMYFGTLDAYWQAGGSSIPISPASSGANKAAVTFKANGDLAYSLNGNAVETLAKQAGDFSTESVVAFAIVSSGTMLDLTQCAAKPDADLPTLSAL